MGAWSGPCGITSYAARLPSPPRHTAHKTPPLALSRSLTRLGRDCKRGTQEVLALMNAAPRRRRMHGVAGTREVASCMQHANEGLAT